MSEPRTGDHVILSGRVTEIRDGQAYVEVTGSTGCHNGNVWIRLDVLGDGGEVTIPHSDFSTALAAAALLATADPPAPEAVRSRLADLLARYDVHLEVT